MSQLTSMRVSLLLSPPFPHIKGISFHSALPLIKGTEQYMEDVACTLPPPPTLCLLRPESNE
jgi:hypothetical protein